MGKIVSKNNMNKLHSNTLMDLHILDAPQQNVQIWKVLANFLHIHVSAVLVAS